LIRVSSIPALAWAVFPDNRGPLQRVLVVGVK
jgi:hypothetical protein